MAEAFCGTLACAAKSLSYMLVHLAGCRLIGEVYTAIAYIAALSPDHVPNLHRARALHLDTTSDVQSNASLISS